MNLFKATALALVAAMSVTATSASATNYGYGYAAPAPTHAVNYHGGGHGHGHHTNWGHYNPYSVYHVHGVSYHDHLNVRHGPGVRNYVVYTLPYNAYGVQLHDCTVISTSRGPSRWCLVSHQGHVRGWVNARFLSQSY
jgi:hypothetical protein